jgi:hypothetical protein
VTGPLYFHLSDYRRCYLLPDTVTCNIARRPTPAEPGSYGHARGLLVGVPRTQKVRFGMV